MNQLNHLDEKLETIGLTSSSPFDIIRFSLRRHVHTAGFSRRHELQTSTTAEKDGPGQSHMKG